MDTLSRGEIKGKKTLLLLFVFAFGIASAFQITLPADFENSPDYVSNYRQTAVNLARGQGFTLDSGEIASRYPPGFAVVLAVTVVAREVSGISEQRAVYLLMSLCFGLSVLIVYLIGKELWNQKGALIASLLWMTYLPVLWLVRLPSSELPFLVAFLLAIYLFFSEISSKSESLFRVVPIGLALGGSMLIRPVAIGLPFLLALLLCILKVAPLKKKIVLGSVLVFLSFLPLLPWQVHVFNKTGQVSLLGTLGPAALRDGLTFGVFKKGFREGVEPPDDVRKLMTRIASRYPEMDTYSGALNVMKDEFAAAPIATIKLYFYKAARSWYATDSQRNESELFFVHLLYCQSSYSQRSVCLEPVLKGFRKNSHCYCSYLPLFLGHECIRFDPRPIHGPCFCFDYDRHSRTYSNP